MAETINLPKQVINSNWKDDVDVDYAIYGDTEKEEREYISPKSVDRETRSKIEAIKKRNIKLGHTAMLFGIKDKLAA